MKLHPTIRRLTPLMIAVAVASLTFAVVAQATQTISAPNAATVTYNLGAGDATAGIAVPTNVPVFVMAVCLTPGARGVAHVSMLSIPGEDGALHWLGLDSAAGAPLAKGISAAPGTHILSLDFAQQVDLEVKNVVSFRVRNTSAGVRTGRVTLIW